MSDRARLPQYQGQPAGGQPKPLPPTRRTPDSTMPGLSSTASSLRTRAQGQGTKSRLSQAGWTAEDDGFEEGPGDTQRQLEELRGGIVMPGMGNRSVSTGAPSTSSTSTPSSSSSAAGASRDRVPVSLKSALKKPAPLLRRATAGVTPGASSTGAATAPKSTSATASQSRFKGTPPRAIRYSLPVRAEKPVRTTKTSGKHVVLPSESQLAPLPAEDEESGSSSEEEEDEEESSEDEHAVTAADVLEEGAVDAELDEESAEIERQKRKERREAATQAMEERREQRAKQKAQKRAELKVKATATQGRKSAHARAPPRIPKASGPAYHTFERMAPAARIRTPLPRLTSCAIGTDLHIPTLNGFLRREHGVRPRLYDECAYVVYFKPLLPGFGRANLRSSPEPRTGSDGGESRRERELEEREERGYVGSYFVANKDDAEEAIDPQGYIQGGEGSGSGANEGQHHGSDLARVERDHEDRNERYGGETTENETETENENERDREGGREQEIAEFDLSSSPREDGAVDVSATPRALQPRRDDLPELPALDSPEPADIQQSSSPPRQGETSFADAAGARDMLIHQQEDEAAERGHGLSSSLEDSGINRRAEGDLPSIDLESAGVSDPSGTLSAMSHPSASPAKPRRGRVRRSRSGPNQASHNRDASPNMLTSRDILEALQVAEMIVLPYGVIVFYNFTASEERDIIEDIISSGCVRGVLNPEDVETEAFHFCYDPTVPAPRIFNDFFTFRAPNHLLKLSLAHAIAQSTKLSVFEESMQSTLELTSHIPKELASTGELKLKRREALRLTGRLFKLRVDVNLTSNVLDTPELFWSEATLQALYDAIREYLEIDARVGNLNDRLKVANDLLEIIHGHGAEEAMSQITVTIIALILVAVGVAAAEVFARLWVVRKRA